jgi:hypothetical protein
MPIEVNSEDAIWISGDLYCKTPEALAIALEQCRTIGYEIQDNRLDGHSTREGRVTPKQMEKNGWSLWYASIDVRRGKCGSCGSYITTRGILAHGNKCEVCDAVTHRHIINGSTVRFRFVDDEAFGPDIKMKVFRYDPRGWLYLEPWPLDGGFFTASGERGLEYLRQHADKWELVRKWKRELIKLRYQNGLYIGDSVINMSEIWGHEYNATIVKVWDGQEYREWDKLPIPESFSIYETWQWTPLEPSPTLHKRVLGAVHNTDDKGWHYQDGRPWFRRETFAEMGKFVRHFTTLDADAWDEQSQRFRLDGPGGIDDVAWFCHPEAEVENRPNIGNFLVGLSKAASGEQLTAEEAVAMSDAWNEDPDTVDFAKAIVTGEMPQRKKQ